MIPNDFTEFFVSVVGVTGALIGLLFVAVSLAPRRLRDPKTAHLAQAQASTALLVFTNTLTLGLLTLLPGINISQGLLIISAIGMIYCGATARVAFARASDDKVAARAMRRIAILGIALTACETWAGIQLTINPHALGGVYTLASTMIGTLLFGISRAWELVGMQGNSIFRSMLVLHHPEIANPLHGPEDPDEEANGGADQRTP